MRTSVAMFVVLAVLAVVAAVIVIQMRTPADITQEQYDQLKLGTSYSEVQKVLGRAGKPTYALEHYVFMSKADNQRQFRAWSNYIWRNQDGSGVMLSFDDKRKLVEKNICRLDMPGVFDLEVETSSAGKVTNKDALKAFFGEKTSDYIRYYEAAAREDLGPPEDESSAEDEEASEEDAGAEDDGEEAAE